MPKKIKPQSPASGPHFADPFAAVAAQDEAQQLQQHIALGLLPEPKKAVPAEEAPQKSSDFAGEGTAATPAPDEPFEAKAFLKTVPNRPGCYRMYGARDEVIYVGKAKDLKRRLSSYFMQRDHSLKTRALVSHIRKIEFTVTFSESEALILENELIKKYQPRYNILLRDDKSYPYLLLTSKQDFPGIYYHRGPRRQKGEYFGPFPDATEVKDSLRLLQKIFPIRQCADQVFAHRSRPCLMAQMGKCLAPCVPLTAEQVQHYHEQVDLLRLFLQGHNQELLQSMVAKMEAYAQNMEFEQAARMRDQLTALRRVQESNSIVSDLDYPVDVIGFAVAQGVSCVHVLFIRNGRIFGTRSFFPQHTAAAAVASALATESEAGTDVETVADKAGGEAAVEVEAETAAQNNVTAALDEAAITGSNAHDAASSAASSATGDAFGSTVDLLLSFLSQFYLNEHHAALMPDEVVLDISALNAMVSESHVERAPLSEESEPLSAEAASSTEGVTPVASTQDGTAAAAASADAAATAATAAATVADMSLGEAMAPEKSALTPPDLHVTHKRRSQHRKAQSYAEGAAGDPSGVGALPVDAESRIALASEVVAAVKAAQDKSAEQDASATLNSDEEWAQPAANASTPATAEASVATGAGAATAQSAEALSALAVDSTVSASALSAPVVGDEAAAACAEKAGAVATDDAMSAASATINEALAVLKAAIKESFGKSVRFVRGTRGAKRRFVQLAMTNAQVALQSRLSSVQTAQQRITSLEKLLGISGVTRMECYDISHTLGELTVGSCVVFNREGPDTTRYRRYNIEGITKGDDFAAMHQVLTRRFRDPDSGEVPELIFIDGGPGQLKQAEEVLTAAFAQAQTPMPTIVAVAKGEGRKEGLETLIRGFTHERLHLGLGDPALQLVLHIRDESHRFAITGHRNRRSKARRTSTLESIAGVGPKRRQALLQHLGGIQEVKNASVEELAKVPGISQELAEKIYVELHGA